MHGRGENTGVVGVEKTEKSVQENITLTETMKQMRRRSESRIVREFIFFSLSLSLLLPFLPVVAGLRMTTVRN